MCVCPYLHQCAVRHVERYLRRACEPVIQRTSLCSHLQSLYLQRHCLSLDRCFVSLLQALCEQLLPHRPYARVCGCAGSCVCRHGCTRAVAVKFRTGTVLTGTARAAGIVARCHLRHEHTAAHPNRIVLASHHLWYRCSG